MQKLITGKNSIRQLPSLLNDEQVIFVCSRRWISRLAEYAGIEKPVILHPPTGLCGLENIPEVSFEQIVAIGGGRIIDFAKAVIYKNSANNDQVTFIAIPTTAGSGSEATPFAVMYQEKLKLSIESPDLLPSVVILDGGFLEGLSEKQKAISGADAFSQSIEAMWSKNATPRSTQKASKGLELLYKILPEFVKGDQGSAAEMQTAAYLSGEAIAITRTTAPHALSYYLTANHQIPHGQAVALFLPLFFLYNQHSAKEGLENIYRCLQVHNAEDAFTLVRKYFSSIGLAVTFSQLDVSPDIERLVDSVNHERFGNNPAPFDREALIQIIKMHL